MKLKSLSLILLSLICVSCGSVSSRSSGSGALDSPVGETSFSRTKQDRDIPAADLPPSSEMKALTDKDIKSITAGINDFSFRLAEKTREEIGSNGNYIISPFGVAYLLSMTVNGSEGKTREEILSLFGLSDSDKNINRLNGFCDRQYRILNGSTGGASMCNSIWVNKGIKLQRNFIKCCNKIYHAGIFERLLSTEQTKEEINEWVRIRTNDMIKNFLVEPLEEGTLAALLNTIYFKGKWDVKFYKEDTCPGKFNNEDGTEGDCELMRFDFKKFDRLNTEKFEIVRFPLDSARFGIDIILPHEGIEMSQCLEYLNGRMLSEWNERAEPYFWDVIKMPKWEVETGHYFHDSLISLGLENYFNGMGDMPGITSSSFYEVDDIYQKAKFIVDENGAEAAAATIDTIIGSAGPYTPKRFILDRPFMYMLTDTQTGLILFIGEIRSFPNEK